MLLSLKEIAERAGFSNPLCNPQRMIETLVTDSRALVVVPEGALFFALRTEVGDGHHYLADMRNLGVKSFVVSNLPDNLNEFPDCDFIVVESPWRLLQKLGAIERSRFRGTLAAITGSQGKTTVKEYLFQALAPVVNLSRSPRSFNSRLGVPLSLWHLSDSEGVAIIEAGISRPDEMKSLAGIISPDVAVFTNIGTEHLDNFSSLKQLADEKALLATGASVAVCSDRYPELLANLEAERSQRPDMRLFVWSRKNPTADLFITSVSSAGDSSMRLTYKYKGTEDDLLIPLPYEEQNVENIATVIATALALGYSPDILPQAMERIRPVDTRLDMAAGVNGCQLIYDSFTPDFDSLETAVDFLKRRADGLAMGRTLILGTLSDLPSTKEGMEHFKRLLDSAHISRLICMGSIWKEKADQLPPGSVILDSAEKFLDRFSTSDFSSEIILIKGADPEMETIRTELEARTHETVLEVNLDAIVRNLNYFRSHLPASTGIVAMVKASGYGAGSVEIAKTLQQHGAAYLAVAVLDEGIELRRAGITMPVMVMNPKVVNYKAMFANRLEPEIYSLEMLDDVIREAAKNGIEDYPVHIKLDTGMHRMGFVEEELPILAERLRQSSEVRPASVFSHLATADCPDMDDYTLLQLQRFEKFTDYLAETTGITFKRHILNSAGILRFPQYHYDMARLGIGLYGANTLPPEMERPLDNVSTLRTVIIAVKEREAGETIGYARKGVLHRPSRIATIPIGYADGMNRRFGNGRSSVWVNGHLAPTVGNICMDACMIDVTDIPCRPGDVVEVFGPHVPVQRLADILETIPYEVLTSISPRVKRIYYRE